MSGVDKRVWPEGQTLDLGDVGPVDYVC